MKGQITLASGDTWNWLPGDFLNTGERIVAIDHEACVLHVRNDSTWLRLRFGLRALAKGGLWHARCFIADFGEWLKGL